MYIIGKAAMNDTTIYNSSRSDKQVLSYLVNDIQSNLRRLSMICSKGQSRERKRIGFWLLFDKDEL